MNLLTLVTSFAITIGMGILFIPYLKKLKFGQSIREEGPESHYKKSGTPTMGGIIIVLSIVLTFTAIGFLHPEFSFNFEYWLLLFVLLGFGLLGFLDDFIKIMFKRNLGLTSRQKFIGQLVISIVFYLIIKVQGVSTAIQFPGTDFSLELGWFYGVLVVVMLVGASNAVNLTDGLDGLLAGTASIAFGAFAFIISSTSMNNVLLIFSLSVVGALIGFLLFNAHPAQVFMGDTGSLALGAALAGLAILSKFEVLLVIVGAVFVIETLSVILQVLSFKLTGKRIFKMSPIHHHFELSGWSEWKVVLVFWSTGAVFALIGILLEVIL